MSNTTVSQAKVAASRILIVDDHPIVRWASAQLIDAEPDLAVCGQAADAAEALSLNDDLSPDVILLDISMPGPNGIELIKALKKRRPDARMLVLSMHDESLYAERALRAGALGYVCKSNACEEVVTAIRQVLSGEIYLSRKASSLMLGRICGHRDAATGNGLEALSDRQMEIFELIGRGLSTRQMASQLHLSVKTIETHRDHIRTKLGVKTAAELSRVAMNWISEKAAETPAQAEA